MTEELEDYLLTINSPEFAAVIIDCANTLTEAGISSHIDDMTDLIALEESITRKNMSVEIQAYYNNLLEATINQFGIFLTDEFPFRQATALLAGITLLTNWDDRETIESICMAELPPEDKLFTLLEMVTEYTFNEYVTFVERVQPAIFNRLLEIVSTVEDDLEAAVQSDTTYIVVRLRSLLPTVEKPWLMEELSNSCTLGLSLPIMLEKFKVRYEVELAAVSTLNKDVETLAAQYTLYVLASNTSDGELLRSANEGLADIIEHNPTLVAVTRLLSKYLSKASGQ